ncbi:MAG TPA: HupE/UreJ family protein [Microvirga sp.]|jgi:urease accessory protein
MIRFILPAALLITSPALAHTGLDYGHSFTAGFLHPLLGIDHLLAMVAVGFWAGLVGGTPRYTWPLAFVIMMIGGTLVSLAGLNLLGMELMIAFTVGVLGLFIALRASVPMLAGMLLCGAFAFVHGFAHGSELPAGAEALSYIVGFTLATAILHVIGLFAGTRNAHLGRAWISGTAGASLAATGLVLMLGA